MTSATSQAAPVGSPGSRRPAPPGLPRRRHRSRARQCRGRGHRARPPGPRAGFRDLPDRQTRGDAARRGRRDRLRPVAARQRRPDTQFPRRHAKPSGLPDIVAWIAALRPCTHTPTRNGSPTASISIPARCSTVRPLPGCSPWGRGRRWIFCRCGGRPAAASLLSTLCRCHEGPLPGCSGGGRGILRRSGCRSSQTMQQNEGPGGLRDREALPQPGWVTCGRAAFRHARRISAVEATEASRTSPARRLV